MPEGKQFKFTIIPDEIIQSQNLNNGAKLLLGRILRLSSKYGYCWASNKYFANYFGVERTTIIRWINELKEYNHIKCSTKINKRKITISKKLLKNIYYCQVSETTTNLKKLIHKMYQYKLWKEKIKERDKKCKLCGLTEAQQIVKKISIVGLEAHHIIPITLLIDYHHITNKKKAKECKLLWDISNGITLCDECHRMKHGIKSFNNFWREESIENATGIKSTTGSKNATISIPKGIHREPRFKDGVPLDDFKIKTKEWKNKQGQIKGIDTIDYED